MKANDMVQVEEANNEGERIVYDCKLVVKGTPSEVREAVIRTDILLSEADRTLTEIVLNTPRNTKSSQNVVSDDVLDVMVNDANTAPHASQNQGSPQLNATVPCHSKAAPSYTQSPLILAHTDDETPLGIKVRANLHFSVTIC